MFNGKGPCDVISFVSVRYVHYSVYLVWRLGKDICPINSDAIRSSATKLETTLKYFVFAGE